MSIRLASTWQRTLALSAVACGLAVALGVSVSRAEDPVPAKPTEPAKNPPGLLRLSPEYDVWFDKANRRVVMVGEVCLREGQMEMFACLKYSKEHESVVAVPTKAYIVHAALVAAGAEPGNPAKFLPKYEPARGTEIEVTVYWADAQGKRHEARAQDWLKNVKTGKAMDQPWVFGGSNFWQDPMTGKRHYQAEEGDFICVSNFVTAMLDVPVESSQANNSLLFEGYTERIPPKGTLVTVVLTPKLKDLPPTRGGDPKADEYVTKKPEPTEAKQE